MGEPNKPKKSTAAPVQPRVRFIQPAAPRGEGGAPSGKEPDATQLVFGFWDNAIQVLTVPIPGGGSVRLLHDQEPETLNLVGGDSRRFHITVEDPGAAGKGFVEVDWWSAYSNSDQRTAGVVHDDPGGVLTLLETKPGSGVFVSKGLMLVNDLVDRQIAIHSGISPSHPLLGKAHGGLRKDTMTNFRVRRAGMFGFSVARYQSKAMKAPVTVVAPVFSPSSRRLLPVQVYVLRDKPGGAPSVPLADVANRDLRVVTETYERHGIWLFTTVSPPDLAVAGTTMQKVGSPIVYTILEVDPPKKVGDAKVTEDDMDEIARVFPAQPNTLRLFFVEDILYKIGGNKVLGVSYGPTYKPEPADPDNPSLVLPPRKIPVTTQGTAFVRLGRDPYTAAHELGHLLMPKTQNGGHYSQRSSVSAPGERHVQDLNLMVDGSRGQKESFLQTKRIWDLSDGDSHSQLLDLGLSPFLR